MPFIRDNQQSPHGSINQVIFSDRLACIRPDLVNKRSGAILGSEVLEKLFLDEGWDRRINQDDQMPDDIKESVIHEVAERFATLLYVLHKGYDYGLIRDDWGEEEWLHWKNIKTVVLGGGFIKGFGDKFIPELRNLSDRKYKVPIEIEVHKVAEEIVLYGLKSHATGAGQHLLMDFGGTAIKYQLYNRSSGSSSIEKIPSSVIESKPFSSSILSEIKKLIHHDCASLHISVASYLKGHLPISTLGIYGEMRDELDDFLTFLEDGLNMKGQVFLYHDATVAADPFRDRRDTVVITIGTALGCGYIE